MDLLRFATILFVSVILFSILTIPWVASQTATTITSILTSAGVFTSSSYSTAVVGSTTLTGTATSTIISNTVNTVSVFGPAFCSWTTWTITVDPGTSEVTGTIGPSSYKIGFYIMNQQQLANFRSSVSVDCSGPFDGEVVVQSVTSAYSLDWRNPPAGTYYVLFFNSGGSSIPIATPFFLVATSTQQQTSTVYSVATAEVPVPTTETMTSLQVSQIAASNPLTNIPGFPWESLLLGFLIGLAILVLKRSKNAQRA